MEMIRDKQLKEMEEEEHKKFHRKIVYVFIIILLFLFGGATLYHYVEGWGYLDALYFSASTITTVGYGDITPKTDLGKIFTIFYLFAGVGIAIYGLSLIASHFVEVREEFWLERLGKIKLKYHPKTFWDKLKDISGFKSGKIVDEYEKSTGNKK